MSQLSARSDRIRRWGDEGDWSIYVKRNHCETTRKQLFISLINWLYQGQCSLTLIHCLCHSTKALSLPLSQLMRELSINMWSATPIQAWAVFEFDFLKVLNVLFTLISLFSLVFTDFCDRIVGENSEFLSKLAENMPLIPDDLRTFKYLWKFLVFESSYSFFDTTCPLFFALQLW